MPDAQPRWMLAPPGGPSGPCWGIVEPPTGRTVAALIAEESEARLFLAARELRDALLAQRIAGLGTVCFCPDDWFSSGATEHAHWCRMGTAALEKAGGGA